ncbi:hypothetical protein CANARDRAFT_184368, partial [[Candida] arabinofermentans NRRL YB-2248]
MGKTTKKGSRQPTLFDIRLRSTDRNVIVLKGPENEAAPALFSGVIALSVVEPTTIKKLSLKLYATLKLQWDDTIQGTKTSYTRPIRYSKILYDFEWDSLNLQGFLQTHNSQLSSSFESTHAPQLLKSSSTSGFTTGKLTRSNHSSSTSLSGLGSSTQLSKHKSSSNLSSLNLSAFTSSSSSKNESVTLPEGNYEFPFHTVLDGSIPESVEGLPGCSLVYILQSTIERGRFSNPIVTKKHIHVIRTLAADAPDLTETVAVDNTWPGKVDYSISVPTRSVAIGSKCQIEMILVPLMKGLKLGNVKISLIEHYSYATNTATRQDDREILKKTLRKVTVDQHGKDVWTDAEMDIDGVFYRSSELVLAQDKWEINTALDLPAKLANVTQDCDISHYIKVRHKLKFSIALINSDGHASELRATLPISLFISPFVPIEARVLSEFEDGIKYQNAEDVTIHYKGEQLLFEHDPVQHLLSNPATPSGTSSNHLSSSAPFSTQDLMAPPNYENHVYDRIWSEVGTPAESPMLSGTDTPRAIDIPAIPTINATSLAAARTTLGEFNMTPAESRFSSQLMANLTQLHHQSNETPSVEARGVDYFSFSPAPNEPTQPSHGNSLPSSVGNTIHGPAFGTGTSQVPSTPGGVPSHSGLMSPGVMSPVQHLSRVNSFIHDASGGGSPALSYSGHDSADELRWDGAVLSKVPSYETAIRSDVNEIDMTPAYQPPTNEHHSSSHINLDLLDSRLRNVNISQSNNTHSHTSSSPARLSRNQTSTTMQLLARNKEHSNLTSGLAKSRGSSSNTSPAESRNQSSANLMALRASSQSILTSASPQPSGITSSASNSQLDYGSQASSSIAIPDPASVHSPTHASFPTSSSSISTSSNQGTSNIAVGALKKRPDLLPRSSSGFHLHLHKSSGSFTNLNFLHKKDNNAGSFDTSRSNFETSSSGEDVMKVGLLEDTITTSSHTMRESNRSTSDGENHLAQSSSLVNQYDDFTGSMPHQGKSSQRDKGGLTLHHSTGNSNGLQNLAQTMSTDQSTLRVPNFILEANSKLGTYPWDQPVSSSSLASTYGSIGHQRELWSGDGTRNSTSSMGTVTSNTAATTSSLGVATSHIPSPNENVYNQLYDPKSLSQQDTIIPQTNNSDMDSLLFSLMQININSNSNNNNNNNNNNSSSSSSNNNNNSHSSSNNNSNNNSNSNSNSITNSNNSQTITINGLQVTRNQIPKQNLQNVSRGDTGSDDLKVQCLLKDSIILKLEKEIKRIQLILKSASSKNSDPGSFEIPKNHEELYLRLTEKLESTQSDLEDTKLRLEAVLTAVTLNPLHSATKDGTYDEEEIAHKIISKMQMLTEENEEMSKMLSYGKSKEKDIEIGLLRRENQELKRKIMKLESKVIESK